MPLLVSEITTRAAEVYLNDRARDRWTDAILLPTIKDAWDKLQTSLLDEGIELLEEESAVIDVAANSPTLALPADFVYPMNLYEKPDGAPVTDFIKMNELPWLAVDELPAEDIVYWSWREDQIKLSPASVARDIKLQYKKLLVTIVDAATDLAVLNILYRAYLSAKVAALASMFDGENSARAIACEGIAQQEFDKIVNIYNRKRQSMGVRRRPFDGRRR